MYRLDAAIHGRVQPRAQQSRKHQRTDCRDWCSGRNVFPSPVTRHPSPVTRHPSPVTRHPSPVTRRWGGRSGRWCRDRLRW
ncbi:hypothetical protein F3N42_09000 [Marinihelvus fidelis]|uniref:Uncharacterized protein n=1 Tax=Marinihelvus fidelis TaxID=2613842 RepID=A0A5N0T8V2_9GAMM|nr:hypothetical protein F3N42_09000 [Marinihelvus fidelis]